MISSQQSLGYRLSRQQERMWRSGAQKEALVARIRVEGAVDPLRLRDALRRSIERHEILRTRIEATPGASMPSQIIDDLPIEIAIEDFDGAAPVEQRRLIEGVESELRARRHETDALQIAILRFSSVLHHVVIAASPLCCDLASIHNLAREASARLLAAYEENDADPPLQYVDYAAWQEELLSVDDIAAIRYWRRRRDANCVATRLPFESASVADGPFAPEAIEFRLPDRLARSITRIAADGEASSRSVYLGAWIALLSRHSEEKTVSLYYTSDGRSEPTAQAIGAYSLLLPFTIRVDPRERVGGFLGRLRAALDEDRDWLDFAPIVEIGASAGAPLPLGFELVPAAAPLSMGRFTTTVEATKTPMQGFRLGLRCIEEGDMVRLELQHDARRMTRSAAERLIEDYAAILEQIVEAPEASLSHALAASALRAEEPLSADERRLALEEWNDTTADESSNPLLHRAFEAQAARAPERTALVCGDVRLSYGELNADANRLAHRLRALGVGPETIVGLCFERSAEMIVALLGVLKAGGAYLPLDPDYPRDRLAFMIADAAPALVLTTDLLRDRLPEATPLLRLDADRADIARERADDPALLATPSNLAYVIYTSGSTGRPKGVAVCHRGVANYTRALVEKIVDREGLAFALVSTLAADLGNTALFASLAGGGALHLVPQDVATDAHAMRAHLARNAIDVIKITPSHYDALMQAQDASSADGPTTLVLGGEPLSAELLKRIGGGRRIVNHYGPTETTIGALTFSIPSSEPPADPPIGRPIANMRAYIVDDRLEPVAIGAAGELLIGGAGLARGYLGRADLTAERFSPDPFGAPGERLYRTGDLARRRADGEIVFLGRIDHQVKIRGFRVELGEIEAALARLPEIRGAAVLAREDRPGETRLVAYLVTAQGTADLAELRATLARELPDHMIPSLFVVLDSFPLTANGKIDRKALPAAQHDIETTRLYVAPRTAAEAALCGIFAETLGLERVGVHDDFFALGGHSLLAIRLIARIKRHGLQADVRALFADPTPAGLAAAVERATRVVVPPNLIPHGCTAITPEMLTLATLSQAEIDEIVASVPGGAANVQDVYPLAPLQEGILFHHLLATASDPYVIEALLAFDTCARLEEFLEALRAVIARHDILRTAVVWEGLAEPMQVVWREAPLVATRADLDPAQGDIAEQLRGGGEPIRIDVRRAPMIDARFARDSKNGRWLLRLRRHHLIDDNLTVRFVIAEMESRLGGVGASDVAPTPFRDFVAQARLGVSREEHEAFFRAMLSDVTEPTAPFGLIDAQRDGSGVEEARLALEPMLARRLHERARSLGVSAASLFHLAFAQVLARASSSDDVVFGTVLFGRMHGGEGAEQALGVFINTLPLRIRLGGENIAEAVKGAHDRLAGLLRHEHASLALAQRCSGVAAPAPIFSAILNCRRAASEHATLVDSERLFEGVETLRLDAPTNYALHLSVDDFDDGLLLTAQTRAPLDPNRLCAYMRVALENIATALERAPQAPARSVDILPSDERHRLLVQWNDTGPARGDGRLLHHAFETQAARAPDRVALVVDGAQLSYGELNARADRLSRRLRALGVGPEAIVGLCVERSFEMMIGLLGVLKAGGAYLPIDPALPRERIAFMIADAAPSLVLAQTALRDRLPDATPILGLDADPADPAGEGADDRAARASPHNLAYVLYTSGSTGRPKGVMIAHGNAVNFVESMRDSVGLTQHDRVLALTTFSFDISIVETLLALGVGAQIVLPAPRANLDPSRILETIATFGVSLVQATPATWGLLAEAALSQRFPHCRAITGGEAPPPRTAAFLAADFARAWNGYGPTETTVYSTLHELRNETGSGDGRHRESPIGRPIASTQIYLLGPRLDLTPIGAAGELHIGGAGVARGYLARPDLTAERFVPDPFGPPGARLYRTGDLARYRADGEIEYLGRIDHQVKIRGFRVELGEIESALVRQAGVRTAVVTAREDEPGTKRLVAYLVASETAPNVMELRAALERELPDHMIPSAFVTLDALPATPSGKIDRKALPAPEREAPGDDAVVAPRTACEFLLAREFCAVLNLERVGVHDDFFRLGGSSLSGARVVDRIRRSVCSDLPVTAIFQAPTVARLAAWIAAGDRQASSPLVTIRGGASRDVAPLYCIHPSGGSILGYRPLADAMIGLRPVCGVQSRSMIDPSRASVSIDAMAADYVDLLRAHRPGGPYHLLGWSMGGLIAARMAEIFERSGESVAFLGLVDAQFGSGPRRASRATAREATALDHLASFAAMAGVEIESRLSAADREDLARFTSQLDARELFVHAASWGQARGFWSDVSPELLRFLHEDREASFTAIEAFAPGRLRAPIHVWWCRETVEREGGPPCDWPAVTSGAARVEIVDGDHESIIRDPLAHAQIIDALAGANRERRQA